MVKLCNNFIKKMNFQQEIQSNILIRNWCFKILANLWTILQMEEQIKIWKWEMIVWVQVIMVEFLTLFLEFHNRGYF